MAGRRGASPTALPAAEHVATAKYWAAEGGQRVLHAATTSTAASASTATTRCTAHNFNLTQWGVLLGTDHPELERLGAARQPHYAS